MKELTQNQLNQKNYLHLTELKLLIISFFRNLGYTKIKECNLSIQIKRGSEFRNGFTFDPLKWKSDIIINFSKLNDIINIDGAFKINTKKQIVTENEIIIWNQVFENFENLILNEKFDSNSLIEKSKKVRNSNVKLTLWILTGAILGLLISIFPSIRLELPLLIPLFVISCSILFLTFGLRNSK